MKNMLSIRELVSIFGDRPRNTVEKYKVFSVLMPLVEIEGETHILFEVRAKHMKTQPGEVCFPGGMIEKGETPQDCAVRETCEELGLSKEDIEILCELDSSRNSAGSVIYRFMGKIAYKTLEKINLSRDEVDEIFLVPLHFFLENEPQIMKVDIGPVKDYRELYRMHGLEAYEWGSTETSVPVYRYPPYPAYPIWGLTGRMMQNFVEIIKQSKEI